MINKLIALCGFFVFFSCSPSTNLFEHYSSKAHSYEHGGDIASAIMYYKKALRIALGDKERTKTIRDLARLYEELGDIRRAVSYYKVLLINEKKDCVYAKRLGYLYYELENYVDSAVYYSLLLDCKTKIDSVDLLKLTKALYFIRKYQKVLKITEDKNLSKLDKLDKQELLFYRAESLLKLSEPKKLRYGAMQDRDLKKIQEAIKTLEYCIALEPLSKQGIVCSFFIADSYVLNRDKDKAIKALERIYNFYGSKTMIQHKIDMIRKYY